MTQRYIVPLTLCNRALSVPLHRLATLNPGSQTLLQVMLKLRRPDRQLLWSTLKLQKHYGSTSLLRVVFTLESPLVT